MNCKPGDMAVMVNADIPEAIGLIVVTLQIGVDSRHPKEYGPVWDCNAVSGAKSDLGYCLPGEWCLIPDAWLRPIRPEPDSAVDESTAWLPPVPTKEHA